MQRSFVKTGFFISILIISSLMKGQFEVPGEKMELETVHFIIQVHEVEPVYLDDLVESLESNYDFIVTSLQMGEGFPKTRVRIYPTIEEFHKGVNMEGSPNWVLGTISGNNEFSMASPLSPNLPVSYHEMTDKLPVHEFTHVVVYNIVDPEEIPYWLWEGISLYMAGQRVDLSQLKSLRSGKFPHYDELNSMTNSFQFGYSLVEYIVDTWGIRTLRSLLLNRGDIESTYGMSEVQFWEEWQNFVSCKYLAE
jgi:hypothetical protein